MPKLRTKRTKFPEGWDLLEPTLTELEEKMRVAQEENDESKRTTEVLWPVFRIHHQRSRYIFDMYYKHKTISRDLYEFCLREKYADAALIAKWKKEGYERLCCLRCVQPRDHNFQTTCICRVPKDKLEEGRVVECVTCGCRGCGG